MRGLLTLFQASFGHGIPTGVWEWKYILNPLASPHEKVVVAVDRDKIVGARNLLLAEMWVKDRKVKSAQPCDTMVHPEYRGKGLFSRMNQVAIEHFKERDYAFFYNSPNHQSRPGYLKQGWRIVTQTEILLITANPGNLILCKLKNKPAARIIAPPFKLISSFYRSNKVQYSGDYRIEVNENFHERLSSVDGLRNKSTIDLVRSEGYMGWRFDRHPSHKYIYITAENDNEMRGYAVVGLQKGPGGFSWGVIVDFLVKNDDLVCFKDIIKACLQTLIRFNPDLISMFSPYQQSFRKTLVKRFGFRSSLRFPFKSFLEKSCLVARVVKPSQIQGTDIYDKSNWRVTDAYMDTR